MKKYRFLILRRFIQISILLLFCMGYYAGLKVIVDQGEQSLIWKILQGNLSSSLVLETIPLSDPFAVLQLLAAGGALGISAIIGALIIFFFYAVFAGRAFCSYVCPLNIVTDAANYLNKKNGISKLKSNLSISRNTRYWLLTIALILSFVFGIAAFETISPIAMLHREIIFGAGFGIVLILAIFIFDLFILKHGFCGHICPIGGFYALISRFSLLKVKYNDSKCTQCMKCKIICPEKQVLDIISKGSDGVVVSGECTRCGRCIEVCDTNALSFSLRSFAQSQKDKK